MPGSGGRGGLPSSGSEPHHQDLSLLYALPSFHLSPYPSPSRGSPPSNRPASPFTAPRPRSLSAHPLSPASPPTPTSSRVPVACLSLPALLLRSPPPPQRAPFLTPVPPPCDCSGNLSSGVPLLPAVLKLRCPGKRRPQLHGLPRGWGCCFPGYLQPAAPEPWAQPRATRRVQVKLAQCSA